MSDIPSQLRYAETHEWVQQNDDGTLTIGITDHAQELLGDLVFVELPETGDALEAGEDCAVVESVKAASDVYSPLAGEVVAVNEELDDSPELINEDPFDQGWLFKIRPDEEDAGLDDLMDADGYRAFIAE